MQVGQAYGSKGELCGWLLLLIAQVPGCFRRINGSLKNDFTCKDLNMGTAIMIAVSSRRPIKTTAILRLQSHSLPSTWSLPKFQSKDNHN